MHFYTKSEEVAYAPACYLWDYLRYSGAIGFLLPVSGGKDSSSALLMLYIMCEKVLQAYNESIGYNRTVMINDLRRICGEIPGSVRELMQKVAYTSYLATSNSSEKTRSIA